MRIAVVGGSEFDQPALDSFLWKLREKYPHATIVTGNGQGAETHVRDSVAVLGFTLEVPALREDWFGSNALACQVTSILLDADVILVVGKPGASRPKIAMDWIHRMNMHQRDQRGGLVKQKGGFVSRREPGSELSWYHIAPPQAKLAQAA